MSDPTRQQVEADVRIALAGVVFPQRDLYEDTVAAMTKHCLALQRDLAEARATIKLLNERDDIYRRLSLDVAALRARVEDLEGALRSCVGAIAALASGSPHE